MKKLLTLIWVGLILAPLGARGDTISVVENTLITEDNPEATVFGPVFADFELLVSSLTFTNLRKAENALVAVRVIEIDDPGITPFECTDTTGLSSVRGELHRIKFRKEGTIHLDFPTPIKLPFVTPGAGKVWCLTAIIQDLPPSVSIPRDAEIFVFVAGDLIDNSP
jgi:hypothetical protein